MKNGYILLIALFVFTFSNAQIVDFPDVNFKYALVNLSVVDTDGDGQVDSDVDTNNDGEIQIAEAEAVSNLLLAYLQNIQSIEGIEYFINLTDLDFSYCSVSQFDLSQNQNLLKLNCTSNPLVNNFDISNNINLEILYSGSCQLDLLDITNNVNLTHLHIFNNLISELDISQNPALYWLSCSNNNLVTLDVSQTPSLITLYCGYNPLQTLDVSHNPALKELAFSNTQITELDLSQNPDLYWLNCYSTNLTELDLSQNPALYWLDCIDNNQLTSLNVQNGNNINMNYFYSFNNPNLLCINVDDTNYANSQICDLDNYTGWCKDDWAEYSEDCILGLEDNTPVNFVLHPNPTQDVLNIETQQPIERVKIYNLQGQLINEGVTKRVDVSQLNTGLYFIQLFVKGKTITKKFIKE